VVQDRDAFVQPAPDFSLCQYTINYYVKILDVKQFYNIAFANSEHRLAKSRLDTTQCQHGKFLSLYFFIKHFSVLIYSYINTRGNWANSKFSVKTLYQHGKCYIFLSIKYQLFINCRSDYSRYTTTTRTTTTSLR
jgi:hypothetical protein